MQGPINCRFPTTQVYKDKGFLESGIMFNKADEVITEIYSAGRSINGVTSELIVDSVKNELPVIYMQTR